MFAQARLSVVSEMVNPSLESSVFVCVVALAAVYVPGLLVLSMMLWYDPNSACAHDPS